MINVPSLDLGIVRRGLVFDRARKQDRETAATIMTAFEDWTLL